MEESKKTPEKTEDLVQRLAAMEELLRQQLAQGKKNARHRAILSVLALCMVVVFGLGLLALNRTVSDATSELPGLIQSATTSVEQLQTTLEDISSLDFEGMNSAITEMDEGLGAVDFEALNEAILDLKTAADGLSRLASLF